MGKFFEKKLSEHEIIVPKEGQIEEQPKKEENEFTSSPSVYRASIVSDTAKVNKSAKVKTDIRYLWSKFVVESGGVEQAEQRCYNDLAKLNQQGGYCDVSGVNFSNPAQAISQVVGNIKEKQEELKKQQENNAERQTAPESTPTPESKSE